jgi:hypothetical protein
LGKRATYQAQNPTLEPSSFGGGHFPTPFQTLDQLRADLREPPDAIDGDQPADVFLFQLIGTLVGFAWPTAYC